jgi:AcrR family transcriptional regulator
MPNGVWDAVCTNYEQLRQRRTPWGHRPAGRVRSATPQCGPPDRTPVPALTAEGSLVNIVNMSDTRRQILEEARDVFLEEGLAGLSMRTVADRVGVSATALYRHFDDKDALLATMLGEAFATFGSYLGRALGGRTPLARFRLTGEAYFDFALDHARDYELMFLTNCSDLGFKRISKEIDERSRPTFEFLVERVEECIEKRVFARREPRQIALYAWSTVHGTASLWLLGQLRETMDLTAYRAHTSLTLDLIERALVLSPDTRRK